MKKLALVLLSPLASAFISVSAMADNAQGFYLGAGFGLIRFNDGSVFDQDVSDLEFRAVELLGGYKYNRALGVDLRLGTNFDKRELTEAGKTREFAIDHYASIYYRPELANEKAKLYGLIGYSQLTRTLTNADGSEKSDSESGFSYGVGIGFVVNQDFNINLEYRRLIDKEDYEISSASVNFDYRF